MSKKEISSMVSVDEDKIDLSLDYVKNCISKNENFTVLDVKEVDKSKANKDAIQEIDLKLEYISVLEKDAKCELEFKIQLAPMNLFKDTIGSSLTKISLDENDIANALKKDTVIVLDTSFKNDPLEDYQVQLKLLNILTPKSILFSDLSACSARSGSWMRYNSHFDLLPSLEYLYNIHAVHGENDLGDEYWFHTHGLNRLDLPEVEVIGINDKDIAYSIGTLVNTVAKLIIENDMPPAETVFMPAKDVDVMLKEFKDVQNSFQLGTLGSSEDDRGDSHSNEAVIIIPMMKNKPVEYSEYKSELTDHPVFMFSSFETSLMQQAARETVAYFTGLFNTHKNNEDFRFILKLGYTADVGTEDEGQEHLWFEVQDIDEEKLLFDAILLNKPYGDVGMREGERGMHDFSRLTDWQISSRTGNYTSANVYLLLNVM